MSTQNQSDPLDLLGHVDQGKGGGVDCIQMLEIIPAT